MKRRPTGLEDLPFQRQGAVRWFSPGQLLHTARLVAVATVLAAFADKREVQAATPVEPFLDHSAGPELWLDYVADIGDGFDATYSVAYLLAQPCLDVPCGPGTSQSVPTQRGSLLVLGGDEVYPTPSARAYDCRTRGPYAAALPHSAEPSPMMLALPGNHDWYDGLTAFLRFFCQRGWVGGWRTEQRRSYFAVKLPHGWWLLALDSQLDTYIDAPQVDYFRAVAGHIQPTDGIILATGRPSWIPGGAGQPTQYASVDYFLDNVLQQDAAQVRVMVSGDSHHYARYAEVGGGRQLITCGGGGAYLSATHARPEHLVLPPAALHADEVSPPPTSSYRLQTSYPPQAESRRLVTRVVDRLPLRNHGFVALMAVVQAALAHELVGGTARGSVSTSAAWDALTGPSWNVLRQPLLPLLLVLLASSFSARQGRFGRLWGALHGLAHVGVALAAVLVVARLGLPDRPHLLAYPIRLAAAALLGGSVATLLMGLYLAAMGACGLHLKEVFSAQSIEDRKSFLRLHLGTDGVLTVHPVAVPQAGHSWKPSSSHDVGAPWLEPGEPLLAHLIEPPIRVEPPAASR